MKTKILNLTVWMLYSSFLTTMISCNDDEPLPAPEFTLQEQYTVKRCEVLNITPQVEAAEGTTFEWKLTETPSKSVDSVLSQTQNLDFITIEPGNYVLQLTAQKNNKEKVAECTITVEDATYSESFTKVLDYKPSPAIRNFSWHLHNEKLVVPYKEHLEKRNTIIQEKGKIYTDLGGWGGYAVFGFDHTIANLPDSLDFAFSRNDAGELLSIVYVAYDKNKNGMPDADEWYEIKGSLYGTDKETKDYEITVDNPTFIYDQLVATVDWKDNNGNSGTITEMYADANNRGGFFPGFTKIEDGHKPLEGWEYPVVRKGKLIGVENTEEGGNGYFPNTYDYDIDWAVDESGKEVHLPGIDFIKVQVAMFAPESYLKGGSLAGIKDLHLKEKEEQE